MKIFAIMVAIMATTITANAKDNALSATIESLIPKLIVVESNGKSDAVGDNGKAKGILQLHSIYIKDVNAFYHKNYTHDDAFNEEKAKEIVRLYLTHYGRAYERRTGKTATAEVLARIHNGGPRGYEKKATDKYWEKVRS